MKKDEYSQVKGPEAKSLKETEMKKRHTFKEEFKLQLKRPDHKSLSGPRG